jgi:hypothetical protein
MNYFQPSPEMQLRMHAVDTVVRMYMAKPSDPINAERVIAEAKIILDWINSDTARGRVIGIAGGSEVNCKPSA